jgi:hypothetical protein
MEDEDRWSMVAGNFARAMLMWDMTKIFAVELILANT